jgi:hypothetical protein
VKGTEKEVPKMTVGISTVLEGGHPMLSGGMNEKFP